MTLIIVAAIAVIWFVIILLVECALLYLLWGTDEEEREPLERLVVPIPGAHQVVGGTSLARRARGVTNVKTIIRTSRITPT